MKKLIARVVRDTDGQDLIEYALLATLIALGCITTMTALGTSISARFTDLGTSITAAS
jgi:pilus assembly protein Flp/PilA